LFEVLCQSTFGQALGCTSARFPRTASRTSDGGACVQCSSIDRSRGDTKGLQMGHYSVVDGTPNGPQNGTPTDTILTLVGVMVKRKARRGGSMQFSGAGRPKSQVRVAKVDPRQFCDIRRLWYNPPYKFSAPQGWRHGVRSRSLGGTHVATLCNHSDKEGSIPVPGIDPSCDLKPKTQSLTNIENDLYQRKTAILIPRYSAV
jgi:hypothetical protein